MKHILKQLAGLAAITAVLVFGAAGTGEAGGTLPVVKVNVSNVIIINVNDTTQLTGSVNLDLVKDKYESPPLVIRNYFPEENVCPAFDSQTQLPTGYYCSVWVSVEQHLPGAVSLTGQNGAWVPLVWGDNLPLQVVGPSFLNYNDTYPLSMPVFSIGPKQSPPWTISNFKMGSNETGKFCPRVHPQADAIKIIAHVRIDANTVSGPGGKGDTVVLEGTTVIPNTCYP